MITIEPLGSHNYYIPICAFWSYSQWYLERDISFDVVVRAYTERAGGSGYDRTLIALDHDFPIGMISLRQFDLWNRKDLSPWLASLYVIPGYRNLGIGTQLMDALLYLAREQGHGKLYLFIDRDNRKRLEQFYGKRNWSFYDNAIDNDGHETVIYTHDL